MRQFNYQTIEQVNNLDWFILSFNKVSLLPSSRLNKKKYILIGKSELQSILVNGMDWFLRETQITRFNSKKELIEKFKREAFYSHLFKKEESKQ